MKAKIMGIVNLTGDSFYPPSRTLGMGEKALLERVWAMIDDGADMLDLGAVSSRPGAALVPEAEEWTRLEPALRAIRDAFPAVELSIDTFRPGIVRRAAAIAGDIIVNDIFAGSADEKMLPTVEELGLRYIAMHIRGNWQTMHDNYVYNDVTAEVRAYFEDFARRAKVLREWWIDPGFGFSKSTEDSMTLLGNLDKMAMPGHPILIGISRKRMTGGSLEKTLELQKIALQKGASVLRVHDVRAARELISSL